MLKMGRWLILETERDFLDKWDERWGRWDHAMMKRPDHFPCGFQYQEDYCFNSVCGTWREEPLETVKAQIKEIMLERQQRCARSYAKKLKALENL